MHDYGFCCSAIVILWSVIIGVLHWVYACLFPCAQVTACVTGLRSLYIWICACWFWHSADIVPDTVHLLYSSFLTSDTKVTFDAFFVCFDVVVFTCLLHFATCFVFTGCLVLCSLLLYEVLIVVMCLYLRFVLWIGVLVFGWCLCCFFSTSASEFTGQIRRTIRSQKSLFVATHYTRSSVL